MDRSLKEMEKKMKKLGIVILSLLCLFLTPAMNIQSVSAASVEIKDTAVTNLKAVSTGTNSVTLTWNKVNGAEGYLIYRQIGKGTYGFRGMVHDVNVTTYTDTTAQTGEFNFYWVFPYKYVNDVLVVGKAAPYVYAKAIPASATNLKAVSAGTNAVKLTWNAVSNVDGYIIYRQVGNGKFEYRYLVSGTSFTDTTAQTGEFNFYRVYPYKTVSGNRIVGLSTDYVYSKPIPNPVTNLKISRNQYRGLTLKWTGVSNVDGYIIYRQNEYENHFSYLGMTSNQTYSDNNIYDADYHYYRVYAYKKVNGKNVVSSSTSYVYGKAHDYPIYNNSVPVKGLKLNQSNLTVEADTSTELIATVEPTNATQSKRVYWSSSNTKVATVDAKGVVTARRSGTAVITAQTGSGLKAQCNVTVIEYPRAGTSSGFNISSYSSSDTVKKISASSRNADGSNTYKITFLTNGNEKWIDQSVTLEVEDATPIAYKNMYTDMGVPTKKLTYEIVSAADYIDETNRYYNLTVKESFTANGPSDNHEKAKAGKIITVNAGMSTRALKVTAKANGKVLDTIYVGSSGRTSSGEYSSHDLDLYKKVRHKVESQLWTSDMSNYQKLHQIEAYINGTTHYPNTNYVKKETNPTFWSKWAVDDTLLFYDLCNDVILNHTMDLQGGITTCYAAQILHTIATEDMGLKNLYDSDADVVNKGEGVWLATGSYSSNPNNPSHMTLWYKDASEREYALDAQGLFGSSKFPCEEHDCLDKLISLK